MAGWSASQDGDGGWQGWGASHPARVPPGMGRWKGMAAELAEQAESVQGGFASCCSGEETDLTGMSLGGSLSQGPPWQQEGTLHLLSAPSLQGCAQQSSPAHLCWPAVLSPRADLSSPSANLVLFKTCFLQSSPIAPSWLPSGLGERPTVVTQCAGREMLSREHLGC